MDEYFAYIDEAGDEGFGKLRSTNCGGQSTWFMIGGIVLTKEQDANLPKWRDEILNEVKSKKSRRDLHFQDLKHEQRVMASRLLSDKPFGACVICSDKRTIPALAHTKPAAFKQYKEKGHLYNYLVRFLLERFTEICARKSKNAPSKLTVTFSRRAGTNYAEMRDYLYFMRAGKEKITPVRSINWSVLNPEDVKVENHANRAGLQIADVVTSAVYKAFEPNHFGDVETRYARNLMSRYIRQKNRVMNYGITKVPSSGVPHDETTSELLNKL